MQNDDAMRREFERRCREDSVAANNSSQMLRARAIGGFADHVFDARCGELRIDPAKAIAAPLASVVIAEAGR